MKTILSVILAVVMIGLAEGNSSAQSRIIASYAGYSNTTQNPVAITTGITTIVDTRGSLVYNITANATGANGECDLYDINALASGVVAGNEVPVYEVKVATSGDSHDADMSGAPLQTFNGLVVSATNATCYINGQY